MRLVIELRTSMRCDHVYVPVVCDAIGKLRWAVWEPPRIGDRACDVTREQFWTGHASEAGAVVSEDGIPWS
eukprot:3915411-Pyramimonas_sp.AAC.2